MIWAAVIVGGLGCYLLKLAGLSLPERVLAHPVVERVADLIPVALLGALVAVQVWTSGTSLTLDARTGGLAFAVVALVLRAALTAALLRLV
jgi:branched-subunit amino acid transport protein